jgi:NAD(P)-dependent dehydrogenase (short-subunit alcohol dehydrogenase family)
MSERFDGKVALVTGAASGIGRASALMFSQRGARVVVADVQEPESAETVRLIESAGGQATFIRTDVARAADVEALVKRTIEVYGRIDCAHNNAGIEGPLVLTADFPEDAWDRVLGINLKGVWLCMKYQIPHMLAQGGGAIVNTSSILGLVGSPMNPAYTAAKHGVLGVTKAAAIDYAHSGIRVNAVCPGITLTPMIERVIGRDPKVVEAVAAATPMRRGCQPEEIAAAAVWLCSSSASYVTGVGLTVDGGTLTQ